MAGKLYLLCGLPGSGKSSWCQEHMDASKGRYVSRDAIRFSMVKEGEPYFSKEKEVVKTYINTINEYLAEGYTVYADATHIGRVPRYLVLEQIKAEVDEIGVIYIKVPLEVALERNNGRDGRKNVPTEAIMRMYNQLEEPSFDEPVDVIYIVEEGKPMQIIRRENQDAKS